MVMTKQQCINNKGCERGFNIKKPKIKFQENLKISKLKIKKLKNPKFYKLLGLFYDEINT
jgi:hypothetical protein